MRSNMENKCACNDVRRINRIALRPITTREWGTISMSGFFKISFFYGFCNILFHFDAEFNNALVIQGSDDNCRKAHYGNGTDQLIVPIDHVK